MENPDVYCAVSFLGLLIDLPLANSCRIVLGPNSLTIPLPKKYVLGSQNVSYHIAVGQMDMCWEQGLAGLFTTMHIKCLNVQFCV